MRPNDQPDDELALDWDDVTPHAPCPICGHPSDCKRSRSTDFASCAHEASEWPLTNGGWLHHVETSISEGLVAAAKAPARE
jgi:hypothetical protein